MPYIHEPREISTLFVILIQTPGCGIPGHGSNSPRYLQEFVSVLPCVSSASLASMHAAVWVGAWCSVNGVEMGPQVLTYKPGSSSRIRRMIVQIGRVSFFPSG